MTAVSTRKVTSSPESLPTACSLGVNTRSRRPRCRTSRHANIVASTRICGWVRCSSSPVRQVRGSRPLLGCSSAATRSALVEGDAFFGFLASGAVEPWLSASNEQNRVVTEAAASAAGVSHGAGTRPCTTASSVRGSSPRSAATGLDFLDYVVLLPSVDVCVERVATRQVHGFTDEAATRTMHAEFAAGLPVSDRHVLRDLPGDVAAVADLIESARVAGELTHPIRMMDLQVDQ